MPRTINLKKVISTELRESGIIGSDPQFDVEILCRRGGSPEFSELIRVVMPIEAFLCANQTVRNHIGRQIQRADFLKGLIYEQE